MAITSARLLNADTTLIAVAVDGVEWSGIRCHHENGTIVIDGDGQIPDAVKAWLADGNTPTPYAASVPSVDDYDAAIQAMIDAAARAKDYRDGFALATYATSTVFGADAQAFIPWRDAVWTYVYAQLAAVLAGQRTQPSIEDFLTEIEAQHPAPWVAPS